MTTPRPPVAASPSTRGRVRATASSRAGGASVATWVLVALLALSAVLLLYAGRRLTFFYDEWDFILGRRGESVGTYLDPHNGHLSLFPVIVYKVLFALVGLRHYWPYRVVAVSLHLICATLVYVLARRRHGPWLALVPAFVLLFLGSAWQDLLWPFQIGFLGSVAGGLAALTLIDCDDRRFDPAVCACLVWSLSSSGVGLAFLIAATVMMLLQRADSPRWWVVVLPAALWVIWYLGWGTSENPTRSALLGAPQYAADAASSAVAGIAGLTQQYGPPLLVAGLVGLFVCLHARRADSPPPLLIAAAAGGLGFWFLASIARADVADPTASRYVYIGATFVLLIAVDATAGMVPSRLVLATLGVLMLGAFVGNMSVLRGGEGGLRATDTTVRASLETVQIAAPVVSPAFRPDPLGAPQVAAGPYLAAVRALGSPALTLEQLQSAPFAIRQAADSVLAQAEGLALTPISSVSGTAPLTVEQVYSGRLARRGPCAVFFPQGPAAVFDMSAHGGTRIEVKSDANAGVRVYLRRLGAQFQEPPLGVATRPSAIRLPVDRAPQLLWHLRLASTAPFTVCAG
jgi:hypothetical protein